MATYTTAAPVANETNATAYKAKGAALADLAIAEARGQGSTWGRFYRSMLDLTGEGRAAFRSTIAAHQKAMNAHVKANSPEGGKADPVYDGAKRSGMVRLSELTTISKALDAGIAFETEWPFHFAVAHARTVLRAQGAGSKAGRPAASWEDKFKEYCAKNIPEGEYEKAMEILKDAEFLKAE